MAATMGRFGLAHDSRIAAAARHPVPVTVVKIALNIGFFMVLFQGYKMIRLTFVQRAQDIGFDNAHRLIALQQRLHLFIEPDLQHWAMSHHWLIRTLNWQYFGFMPVFYVCCALAIAFGGTRFDHLRRVFLFSMIIALPWYAIFPLAPPRFMTSYGLIDTLARFGPVYDTGGGLVQANQFAAMPSMHVGWTTIGAFMLAAAIPWKHVGAVLGGVMVAMMCLTVMSTGNHYLSDVVAGWLVVACAFGLANLSERVIPVRRSAPNTQFSAAGR